MRRVFLTLSTILLCGNVSAETMTLCVSGLEGFGLFESEGHSHMADRISTPVVIQVSDSDVSVMGWPPGSCAIVPGMLGVFCAAQETMETYLFADTGFVYYTKTSLHPAIRGTKAFVGRLTDC